MSTHFTFDSDPAHRYVCWVLVGPAPAVHRHVGPKLWAVVSIEPMLVQVAPVLKAAPQPPAAAAAVHQQRLNHVAGLQAGQGVTHTPTGVGVKCRLQSVLRLRFINSAWITLLVCNKRKRTHTNRFQGWLQVAPVLRLSRNRLLQQLQFLKNAEMTMLVCNSLKVPTGFRVHG